MTDLDRFKLTVPNTGKQLGSTTTVVRPEGLLTPEAIRKKYEQAAPNAGRYLLLFDATGSMTPYWDTVLKSIEEILRRVLAFGTSAAMKIVAYRDDCDGLGIIDASPWTQSAEELKRFIHGIHCTGGGDKPEAVDRALQVALEEQEMSRGILIGDAPPHPERNCRREAKALGLARRPIYTIVVGNDPETRQSFEMIARLSRGKVIELGKLEELFELITIVVVHGMGTEKLEEYAKRYPNLGMGARQLIKSLLPGSRK